VSAYTGIGQDDPFSAYFSYEYWKIQQYNCWHEDRTAAGSGIEARVPFLDHRLVELSMSVPPQLRESLFWDKQILRSAMRGLLPDDVLQRPKGYFFHGEGVRHTYRFILRMLAQDGAALVEEALAAPAAAQMFDGGAVRATLQRLCLRPDEAQVETLLRVVNLGLLSAMLENAPQPVTSIPISAVPRGIEIAEWPSDTGEIENLVGLRSVAGPRDVPRLAEDVMLLTDPTSCQWFLTVNGEIEFVLSEDETSTLWLLRAMDGERSVADLADVLDRPLDEVATEVADLVDQGLATVTKAADNGRQGVPAAH
jgi:asparagine synthase (glutamine-hydrolysing)